MGTSSLSNGLEVIKQTRLANKLATVASALYFLQFLLDDDDVDLTRPHS